MSSGAKAGLAIGILAVALLLGLLFFCFRRRRKHANGDYASADDEKAAYKEGLKRSQSATSTRTIATAPRLTLRPITQFMPDIAARGKVVNGAPPAAALGAIGGAAVGAATSRDHNDPENPFGNHAEVPRESQGSSEKEVGLPIQNNAAENPFGKNAEVLPPTDGLATRPMTDDAVPAPLRIRTPTPEAGAVAGGAVAGAAGGLAAAQIAERHNAPKPLNLTPKRSVSPAASSPAVSEFSQSSVPAAAMVNGPPPSNVHRIQLDFKPSMDDELGLRAGQLVRLLHEYDDGWVSSPILYIAFCRNVANHHFIGTLHPSRPLSTRCRSSHVSFSSPRQASPSTRCTWTKPSRSSTRNDGSWPATSPVASQRPRFAKPLQPRPSSQTLQHCRQPTALDVPWSLRGRPPAPRQNPNLR